MVAGRYLVAAGFVGAMVLIPFSPIGVWLSSTFGPKPEFTDESSWTPGAKVDVKLTLVTADAERLACAHEKEFDGTRCAFKSETEKFPRVAGAPLDDNNRGIIQPYRTSPDNKLVLVSDVWAQPSVAWRLHREPPQGADLKQLTRFVAVCSVTFLGDLDNVKTRWAPGGRWQNEVVAKVGRADSCTVIEE